VKLRSITLNNVRRFTTPVTLDEIGDGLNVLSAPNEFGKSTLFDALQALFFKSHSSADKDIKALKPHAGGAPEIWVDIEVSGERFTVAKRWLSKASATVKKNGLLVAQADEAEAWISGILSSGDGGPSGLLWVRQGLTSLADGSKKEQEVALEVRRDLLSSVTGEVEAMTGGRRMDMALARCRRELAEYVTSSGRPKAGGPWKLAQEQVELRDAEHNALSDRATELRDALADRKKRRRELAELESPDAISERKHRLSESSKELQSAECHAEEIEAEEQKVEATRLLVANLESRLSGFQAARREQAEAADQEARSSEAVEKALLQRDSAEQDRAAAILVAESAQSAHQMAEATRRKAQRREAAILGADRRKDLLTRLDQAQAAREAMEKEAAAAKSGLDAKELNRLTDLASELSTLRALHESETTSLVMHYEPGCEGAVRYRESGLPEGQPLLLTSKSDISIKDVGVLSVRPGAAEGDGRALFAAEEALHRELSRHGLVSLEEARSAAAAREGAERRGAEAHAILTSVAPEGLEALRKALAAIPEPEDVNEGDVPSLHDAEALLDVAEAARIDALARSNAATERLSDARSHAARAETDHSNARDRLSRALATLDNLGALDPSAIADELGRTSADLKAAEALLAERKRSAPDIDSIRAKHQRAQSIEDSAHEQISRLKPELATLDERISRNAGDAVEERLADAEDALIAATARLSQIEREVAILQKLEASLGSARNHARERYFEPVATELRPLLHLLWPEAEIIWGDQNLLPVALVRNGQEEPIDVLSGGTQEQIALLVRLAFARMLAKGGHPAPVILDDALVFTDDDRIERMFDALHRQAGDQQILVLSCRQRAFRELGGNALRVQETTIA
jgi:hypothetical protein